MSKSAPLFFCLFFLLSAAVAKATDLSYADSLVREAKNKNLHRERLWEVLLHYQGTLTGHKSLVSDPRFFLSPNGRKNPWAELEATLYAFFMPGVAGEDPIRCRYPARYEFLKERLNFDESKLPPGECGEFNTYLEKVSPKSAYLIFPASHLNSPSSMFGHTLVRVDSGRQSKLISWAITYSAYNVDSNGLLFAFKGIFGYYPGYFDVLPYYEKIRDYNDIGQRDIWEYRLNLTEGEVRRMVLHAWEMRERYSDYYFFDKNCAYVLLYILEAARPSLRLTDSFPLGTAPVDTVRVMRNSGLIESVEYRPSNATRIQAAAATLSDDEKALAVRVAKGEEAPGKVIDTDYADSEKIGILNTSTELIQYELSKHRIDLDKYRSLFLSTLRARTALGREEEGRYDIAPPIPPDEGHLSGRISLGFGKRGNLPFEEFKLRPAYHDLLDPNEGYIEGTEIDFLNAVFRNYQRSGDIETRLELFEAVGITSLAPMNRFFHPISWKVYFGLKREFLASGREALIVRVNPGGGITLGSPFGALLYAFAEPDIRYSDDYVNRFSAGAGGSAGILWAVTDRYKFHLRAQEIFYELGDKNKIYELFLGQRYEMNRNTCLMLTLQHSKTFGTSLNEALLTLNVYY